MSKINYNIYVFTTHQILVKSSPILRVIHDEDGDWQFLNSDDSLDEKDARIVSLGEIISLDYTLSAVMNLPKGKQANRDFVGGKWSFLDLMPTL